MTTLAFVVLTAALFLAAVLNLALESSLKKRLLALSGAAAGCLGVFFYGYGFCWVYGFTPLAFLRALFAICRMFSGVNELSAIQTAPLFEHTAVMTLFWLTHFMAFYFTAGATITIIGGKLLRRLRVMLLHRGELSVIFGVNDQSLAYGRRQLARGRAVLFVDDHCDAALESAIHAAGAVLEKAAGATPAFLKRLGMGPGSRRMEAAALDPSGARNLAFARSLKEAASGRGLASAQISLLIRSVDEDGAAQLLAQGEAFGFSSVWAFDDYTLAARVLTRQLPPCRTLAFDKEGRASESFHAVLVGFGRMGRAVLDQLVMNGQFEGSAFRADVFDPAPQNGVMLGHPMLESYDIRFHCANAASVEFYRFLNEHLSSLRCLILCTGEAANNGELAQDVQNWLSSRGCSIPVAQCTRQGVILAEGEDLRCASLYEGDGLDLEAMDRRAMAIHQAYCQNGRSALENWQRCDAFSRMSSRAAADFYPAVLRAAGCTPETVRQGGWPPEKAVVENLARTEHLRWCAFHTVMGFKPMSAETFDQRAGQYLAEMKAAGTSALRIGKDVTNRLHACLVDWEELDELSRRENAVTGAQVDYKAMDRNNVLALPQIMNEIQREGEQA